jgi:hypothetical protein
VDVTVPVRAVEVIDYTGYNPDKAAAVIPATPEYSEWNV